MGKPAQQLVAPVMMDNRLGNDSTKSHHPLAEPARHLSAMERKIGAA